MQRLATFFHRRSASKKTEDDHEGEQAFAEALHSLTCSQIQKIAFYLYAPEKVELYPTLLELSKRDLIDTIITDALTDPEMYKKLQKKSFAAIFETVDRDARAVHIANSRDPGMCDRQSGVQLNEPGYCDHGFEQKLNADGSVCCIPSSTTLRPYIWNAKIERQVLVNMNKTLVDLIKLLMEREVNTSEVNLEIQDGCEEEKEDSNWLYKVTQYTNRAGNFAVDVARKFPKLIGATKLKEIADAASVTKAAEKLYEVIEKRIDKVAIEKIKAAIMYVFANYIIDKGILQHIKTFPPAKSINYHQEFANLLIAHYTPTPSIANDLFAYLKDYDPKNNIWSETITATVNDYAEELLKDLSTASFGASSLLLRLFKKFSRDSTIQAMDTVLTMFMYTNFMSEKIDIFTYAVQVFDMSAALRADPRVFTSMPLIVRWANAIEQQKLNPRMKEKTRERNEAIQLVVDSFSGYNRCTARALESHRVFPSCELKPRVYARRAALKSKSKSKSKSRT